MSSANGDSPPPATPAYALADAALLAQCQVERIRASGPGGQHRNKTLTGTRLRHLSTGIEVSVTAHRESQRNRDEALGILRLRLALAQRGHSDPAWLAVRRQGRQLAAGPASPAWHLIVACALDALDAAGGSLADAAATVGLSGTQLARVLTDGDDVHRAADAIRAAHGLSRLRRST